MKITKKCLSVLLVIVLCVASVYCYANPIPADTLGNIITADDGDSSITITTVAGNIWNSVKFILQVVALITLMFTGVKYMIASADQKADMKKSLIVVIIGVVVVFGTTIVIDFVRNVAGELMNV